MRTIGKYRLLRRLGKGGSAEVFRAFDSVEGVYVALKLPLPEFQAPHFLEDFRKEIRIAARLEHPHILRLKNAEFYGGRLVLVYPLGEKTLADRLRHRLATTTCLAYGEQLLDALAYAHSRRVIHCDVKPENLILFPDNRMRLTDFGIAKVAHRTMSASGSGTVGYVAPEQAMGRPSFRSDVFAAGLVLYRMLSGRLPEWPYEWPLPGLDALRRKISADGIALLKRALEVDHRRRYRDAQQMLAAYRRLLPRMRRSRTRRRGITNRKRQPNWRELRQRAFLGRHRGVFRLKSKCGRCGGPLAEEMRTCPWCGTERRKHLGESSFPDTCRRCGRGRKLDWSFCAWCYGGRFDRVADRSYSDKRYVARCSGCRGELMRFSRYCPWCRLKVRRRWTLQATQDRCPSCGWAVFATYWDHCPWCGRRLGHSR